MFGINAAEHDPDGTGRYDAPRDNILFACSLLQQNKELLSAKTSLKGELLWGAGAVTAAFFVPQRRVLEALEQGETLNTLTDNVRQVLNRAGWFQLQGWP